MALQAAVTPPPPPQPSAKGGLHHSPNSVCEAYLGFWLTGSSPGSSASCGLIGKCLWGLSLLTPRAGPSEAVILLWFSILADSVACVLWHCANP